MKIGVGYNERSWAIDLIGYIKSKLSKQNRSIKDASGEQTVKTEGGSLFPDVLLFGDKSLALILQGWELKMPDTSIDDPAFFHNAKQKAMALGLDSFVLWNVSYAHLYVRRDESDKFICSKRWDSLSHIRTRNSVLKNRVEWEALAAEILEYINDLFDRGSLEGRQFVEAYKSGGVTSLIMENTDEIANALQASSNRDANLKAKITLWWNRYRSEYGGKNRPYEKLAQANLSNWIGKFLFAHILQSKDIRAQVVTQINEETTPTDALKIFKKLSEDCNFWTIFAESIGLNIMPERAWDQMRQLNRLLTDLRIGAVDQAQLSSILEATVEVSVRKLRGQYPTPSILANILVRLCVNNIHDDRILDPCCGSGTIPRAALEQKLAIGVDPQQAAAAVFAGDQDHQAVQISTFSMTKPDLMSIPLRLFQKDIFYLTPDTDLEFRDPNTGKIFTEKPGYFDAIISNLPFVAQEGRSQYTKAISQVKMASSFPRNSDVAAYLPFVLYEFLVEGGMLGIIITNSWLSTAWGDEFFKLLKRYYHLESVITSGAGRWFQNSKVVTNILILKKKKNLNDINKAIDFVVLTRPLCEISDVDSINMTVSQIHLGASLDDNMTINRVLPLDMEKFRAYGLGGNAQFVNCNWILDLPLIPVKSLFQIKRGERRGWDKLFYPASGHAIEAEYIRPVLKNSKEISGYVARAESDAFCCSSSIDELEQAGHTGALEWIRRFENDFNNSGIPLTESLKRSKLYWYEMRADSLADLVMPLNYGNRLFITRLISPSFVNQRLMPFKAKKGVDIELCHALLNSAISLFFIEGMGFGRGQGVLDLNKNRVENFMHMLDPNILNSQQVNDIKLAFFPLTQRNLFDIADELEQQDRQNFDSIILTSFGLNVSLEKIYTNLLKLVEIRQTAREFFD